MLNKQKLGAQIIFAICKTDVNANFARVEATTLMQILDESAFGHRKITESRFGFWIGSCFEIFFDKRLTNKSEQSITIMVAKFDQIKSLKL